MKRWRAPFIRMTMLIAVFFAIWVCAAKDDLTGQARIVDGDSLEISGTKSRIYGIDAHELGQSCLDRTGGTYACGRLAKRHMKKVAKGRVTCESI